MFEIQRKYLDDIEVISIVNRDTEEYVSIIPSFGGNINELMLSKNGTRYSVIAGDRYADSLRGMNGNVYRGAKLSPFPNRINQGEYIFHSKKYSLNKNDNGKHALHGLIWNKPFEILSEDISAYNATLLVAYVYEGTEDGYPFHFQIRIEYQLNYNGFTCRTEIVNKSDVSIPVADGWHPYISLGKEIDGFKLKLPSSKRLEADSGLIPTGNSVEYNRFIETAYIGDTVMDSCFELNAVEGKAETVLADDDRNIHIILWQETNTKGYNYVHIYTPLDRQSIAIEPMSCAPDAFNNGKGLIELQPEEQVSFTFGISVE